MAYYSEAILCPEIRFFFVHTYPCTLEQNSCYLMTFLLTLPTVYHEAYILHFKACFPVCDSNYEIHTRSKKMQPITCQFLMKMTCHPFYEMRHSFNHLLYLTLPKCVCTFFHKFLVKNMHWTLKINFNILMSSVHDSVYGHQLIMKMKILLYINDK